MITQDRFARKFIVALQRAGVAGEIEYDEESFALKAADGVLTYLHNAYEEYCQAPFWKRGAVLRRYTDIRRTMVSVPEVFADAQAAVLPYVRDLNYFASVELMQRAAGESGTPAYVYEPLGGGYAVGLAYDTPTAILSVHKDTLEGWGHGFDDVLTMARYNLRLRSTDPFDSPHPGLYVSPWRDNHDAARLVLSEVLNRLDVKGQPVAMVPHRDVLLVTGSGNVEGLVAMAALAGPLLDENRRISASLVRLEGTEWKPHAVAPDHPAASALGRIRILCDTMDYEQQKLSLDSVHEAAGEDLFVANLTLMENPETGELLSYAVWSEDVTTLLPAAEQIAFASPGFSEEKAATMMVPWQRVRDVVGELMQPQGMHPERYLVEAFPSPEQLNRLTS